MSTVARVPIALEDDDEYNSPSINDVQSLKQGIIKTSKNTVQAPYTILLIGETGVGKSSVLEFIANVLIGRDIDHYDFEILDSTNEQGGSDNQSQTNSARLYEIRSNNGIMVRILDTPGLAHTRGTQQDELHNDSITAQIERHINSISAVLILANGTVPRGTVGTNYALSTLSAIFPKALAHNIAFMFSNVLSPLYSNFPPNAIPAVLKDAPQFLFSNPIALQKKYLKLKDDPNMKKTKTELREAVKAGEQSALETLVDLFDWLDNLDPLPATEIVSLCEESQKVRSMKTDTPAPMGPARAKNAKNSPINRAPDSKQRPMSNPNHLCTVPNCYSSCSRQLSPVYVLIGKLLPWVQLVRCPECTHPYLFHCRLQSQGAIGRAIGVATDGPSRLAGEYAGRWPSGSLSALVERATRLLEQEGKDMAVKWVSPEQVGNMRGSLKRVKRALDLLRKVKRWCGRESGRSSGV